VSVGQPVTYTATVSPERHGEGVPAGSVQLLDGSVPIGSCASQPLTPGSDVAVASCTVTYPAAGSHEISAVYLGNEGYAGSTSAGKSLTVKPAPIRKKTNPVKRCRKKHGKAKKRCLRKAHKHHKAH
jgi:hypothetical protein